MVWLFVSSVLFFHSFFVISMLSCFCLSCADGRCLLRVFGFFDFDSVLVFCVMCWPNTNVILLNQVKRYSLAPTRYVAQIKEAVAAYELLLSHHMPVKVGT